MAALWTNERKACLFEFFYSNRKTIKGMSVNKSVLQSNRPAWAATTEFNDSSIRGSYNPMHFVLRLREDVQQKLSTIESGIYTNDIDDEFITSFSVYLHETIHWWQHIGSTIGLLLSLAYPAQSHINNLYLKDIINEMGPFKSIRTYSLNQASSTQTKNEQNLNRILNNYFDIQFSKSLMFFPLEVSDITKDKFFESMGHSYQILWSSVLWLLSSSFDQTNDFLPDPRNWEKSFRRLNDQRVEGFYWGSPIRLAPMSVREIFEGQARFSQIQYLYYASNKSITWEYCETNGLLSDIYVDAFKYFLEASESEWPADIGDPLIGLFLLICDIAINLGDGFPYDLIHHESFILSNDPGIRFLILAKHVAKEKSLTSAIKKFSKDEYITVSKELCSALVCPTPVECALIVKNWAENQTSIQDLLVEESTFKFKNENQPIRVFFSQFIKFQTDKCKCPEIFCWPGAHFAGERCSEETEEIFYKYQALFVAENNGKIVPRYFDGKENKHVDEAFNSFYAWNILYDLSNQWVVEDGPFSYDYSWLTDEYDQERIKKWAGSLFTNIYGHSPESFIFYNQPSK